MWRNLCLKPFCGLLLQLSSLSSLLIQLILSFSYILQAPLYGKNNLEVQLVQVTCHAPDIFRLFFFLFFPLLQDIKTFSSDYDHQNRRTPLHIADLE